MPQRPGLASANADRFRSARLRKYSAETVTSGVSCSSCVERNSQRVRVCAGAAASSGVLRGIRGARSRLGSLRTGSTWATIIDGRGASRFG